MRIKKLIIGDNIYTDNITIENKLSEYLCSWMLKPEIDNAVIEIKDNKIYWYNGVFYYGVWEYGIWLDGVFYGKWNDGVFYNGIFNGDFYNGIFYNGVFNGKKHGGDFRI